MGHNGLHYGGVVVACTSIKRWAIRLACQMGRLETLDALMPGTSKHIKSQLAADPLQ